ncbi:MAG: homocysteine S-methyltransferase family protein [Lachnospiraceae bacterium]|nr:homocysteine S-methyltransferase family protein [Lachnospiraceae bacterium]
MAKENFTSRLKRGRLVLDGATGSNLQKRGMPAGVCPEEWILNNADVLKKLQKEYIEAGSDVLYAPTFSGNRIKLAEYGLEDNIEDINKRLVGITREAVNEAGAGRDIYIAGDITMTGQQVYPAGSLMFEGLVDIYKEQIKYLYEAGADLIVVETMMSLQECRAAVIASKEVCNLPVLVTLTFNEDGRTLYGTSPETAALVLTALGVDAVGVNCSTGPGRMVDIVRKMAAYADIPVIAKPNAGMPSLDAGGNTVYDLEPAGFAEGMEELIRAGADITGGCCGTTPEHIKALCSLLEEKSLRNDVSFTARSGKVKRRALSTERDVLDIELDGNFLVIGERINPTGKKALQAELREGCLDLVTEMAESQEEMGASILDVNMGMNGIDEKEMMLKAVYELSITSSLPLSIDSSHPDVVEEALRIYPGRALINSVSLEPEKFARLIPAARKYGAMFILLPLSEKGLPKDINEKKEIIHKILGEAVKQGLVKEDIVVDGLVATVGANSHAAAETLETIRYCRNKLSVATVCGLSNISFGLPERMFVNSSFMSIAISQGLTMAISNPSQDLLMHSVFAAELLMDKPGAGTRYIERVTGHKVSVIAGEVDAGAVTIKTAVDNTVPDGKEFSSDMLFEAVVKGRQNKIEELVKNDLGSGREAQDIIDKSLIPAINHVGRLFEKQVYFLPQLISSAKTMEKGIAVLEPVLAENRSKEPLGTIVIATVEHDIHDIGKNLVALMLRNYGYNVIDLGKDVPAGEIVDAAIAHKADIIGLSALMTTTMMEMKKVTALVHEKYPGCKVIIGGAVITQGFACEIGADGYSKDAQEAVVLVGKLLGKK